MDPTVAPPDPAPLGAVVVGRMARIWFAALAFGVGLQGIVALFPLYRDELGLGEGDLSLVFSAYMVGVMPGIVLLSPLADRFGRRSVVVPSLAISTAASLLLATSSSLGPLLAGRVLQGLATGAFVAAAAAFARDVMPEARRAEAMLLMTTTSVLGVAVGIALFATLATVTGSRQAPWLVHAGILAVATALVATVPDRAPRSPDGGRLRLGVPVRHRHTFRGLVVPMTVPAQLAGSACLALAPTLLLEAVGTSSSAGTGALAAMYMGVSFLAQVSTRRVERVARLGVLGLGLVAAASVAVAAAVAAGSLVALWIALAVVGVGHGLTFRAGMTVTEAMSDATSRARTIATYTVVFYVTAALGPLAGGYLTEAVGAEVPMLAFALVAAAGTVVAARHLGAAPARGAV